jgi:2-acylglycerol O-acyltransferase 2
MHLKDGPFKDVVGLSSRAMLFVPVVGLFLRLWDVQSVDSKHMKRLMKEGRNISLMPGGFEEATLTTPKELRVYITKRKGFIKYAMENNYSIYPTICMQEHQAFWTFDHFKSLRLWINKWKVPAILYFNPTSLFFLPPKIDFCTIVGKKMQYRPFSPGQPHTPSEIDAVHSAYMCEI